MPYNPETEQFFQAPATIVDSTPDGDTVQEGFDDRLTPAMTGVYTDLNLLKENGMIGVGIPATTTARGIGRVATLADMEPGAVVENGPAFLGVNGGVVTPTPTAHAVPQADEDGKLDGWVSLAGKANTDLSNITSSANTRIKNLAKTLTQISTRSTTGSWSITGCIPGQKILIIINASSDPKAGVDAQGVSGSVVGPLMWGVVSDLQRGASESIIPTAATVVIDIKSVARGAILEAWT